MRMLVTGKTGQLVTALRECSGAAGIEVVSLGRPEFDLLGARPPVAALAALEPDVIVSAAAYTAVDEAETDEAGAWAINVQGPRSLAKAASVLGVPLIHMSTDYVFDGAKPLPYLEGDLPAPLGAYGRTKFAGELAVAAFAPDHVILRTAWLFSPFRKNFLKTMLCVAADREDLRVVDDQYGNPTSAFDLARAVFGVARNLIEHPNDSGLRGIFHACGGGEASWADFAVEIFAASKRLGGPFANVTRITTADFPTLARRPANSRLSTRKLQDVHAITLPHWRSSTDAVVRRLIVPSRSATVGGGAGTSSSLGPTTSPTQ